MVALETWRKSAEALLSPVISKMNQALGTKLYLKHRGDRYHCHETMVSSEFELVKRRPLGFDSVVGRLKVTDYRMFTGVSFFTPDPRYGFKHPRLGFSENHPTPDALLVQLAFAATGKTLVAVTVEGKPCFIEADKGFKPSQIKPGSVLRACTA
jgi:hypothetical protein